MTDNLYILQDLVSSLVNNINARQYIINKHGRIEWQNKQQLENILNDFGVIIKNKKEEV